MHIYTYAYDCVEDEWDEWMTQIGVFFWFWWVMIVRRWLLPALMMGGVLEQTLTNPLDPAQQLLNGIAICFIMDVDNLIWVYLRPSAQEKCTHIMASIEEDILKVEAEGGIRGTLPRALPPKPRQPLGSD